ncbi:hypothetical protein RND71_000970 [Anisodus tanguticus]|uniref:SHSP domain-containing protein n=1 Tax=Anisodus tanguticus TaxID=243964 RepID=A0AAE1SWZ7_9SOLA|nr:hypothetical protein RND71_000970 [Anisodus tanguticus]
MAMKPRGGGRGGSNNRPNRAPRPRVPPLYEDFRPVSERHQEEEAEKLLIFLPGFMKESIRVSTEGKNTVRVRGERFVGGNKWNRFQEDYQAPDDCNMRSIHAIFENGILIFTMPWKMPKLLLDEPTKQPPLTTPPPPHKDDNIPSRTTHPTVEAPRKPTPLKPTAQLPTIPQPPQKDTDFPPKTTYPTIEAPRKPTPLKPTAQNADKYQDSRVKEKQRGEEKKIFDDPLRSAESSKTQQGDEDVDFPALRTTPLGKSSGEKGKPREEKKIFDDPLRSGESSKTEKGHEGIEFPALRTTPLGKTSGEKEKQRDEKKILAGLLGSIEPKIQKSKEESLDQNRTQMVKSGKEVEKEESHEAGGKKVAEKSKELREEFQCWRSLAGLNDSEFSIGNLKRSLAGLNEERQLLVNAGAAVLVIMALGAYVYHSIGSGRAE